MLIIFEKKLNKKNNPKKQDNTNDKKDKKN